MHSQVAVEAQRELFPAPHDGCLETEVLTDGVGSAGTLRRLEDTVADRMNMRPFAFDHVRIQTEIDHASHDARLAVDAEPRNHRRGAAQAKLLILRDDFLFDVLIRRHGKENHQTAKIGLVVGNHEILPRYHGITLLIR